MTTRRASSKSVKRKPGAGISAADSVDEQLARYRSMRDFHVTAEPSGGHKAKPRVTGALPFGPPAIVRPRTVTPDTFRISSAVPSGGATTTAFAPPSRVMP